VTLLVFGLSHFLYIDFTAGMIPSWIPWRVSWAWFTGGAHIAAGLSILTAVQARLGSKMLAVMMSSFVVLVHIPRIMAAPGTIAEWRLGSCAILLAGAAWIVAAALARRPTLESSVRHRVSAREAHVLEKLPNQAEQPAHA
jgi:uncharacterized membrane protein